MYSHKSLSRVENILKKINFIENIVEEVIKERLPLIAKSAKEALIT